MAGLERLHPHLQHAIVHDLGWRSLRPVQELTIDAVLDGANAVVLAPTAGGKTEAALFPVLSRILSEELKPVSMLYVCPIRALLNNQEERLRAYARMVGLEVFKWHGDVSDSKKSQFRRSPVHLLMTTPESLEVMMISERTDTASLFAGLSAVVIDEVHAFAADDRGAHLAALLERLQRLCGRDLQRIGLSATVGNPRVIGEWLQGSSERPFRLVDPPRPPPQRDLSIDLCADVEIAARGIGHLARGKKSLVFVESRARAEKVAHALEGSGVEVFIHHSSVSRADRALAEEHFAKGQNTAIVATSTMELGIDVGDLDQVLQVDAPATVASFLQRMGRTGRRANTRANCSFFCLSSESLLQATALVRLAQAGWVEDVRPAAHAMHVLAHQVMALLLQEGGLSRHRLRPWVQQAYPFAAISEERLQELVDTMLAREILYEADGLLTLGRKGERLYGKKNFFELYAVFSAPPAMRVMNGKEDVGFLPSSFVALHDERERALCFRLAGRAWVVGQVDYSKGLLHVNPAPAGRLPSWLGIGGSLSKKLCETMRDVLLHPGDEAEWLTRPAALELESLRDTYVPLLESGPTPLEETAEGVQWHTFSGGAVNRLLAEGLKAKTGAQWTPGNLSLKAKVSGAAAREAIEALPSLEWGGLAISAASTVSRAMFSKFQPCLPDAAEDRLLAERLFDLEGTLAFLATASGAGVRLARAPAGTRLSDGLGEVGLPALTVSKGFAVPQKPIEWVESPAGLKKVCAVLAGLETIGLDVETAVDLGTLCLVQVATPERTYVIDPFAVGDLAPLAEVFTDAQVTKVIHNARFERRVLAQVGIALEGVFDTLEASRRRHGPDVLGGHSLAAVCERELGVSLDKTQQRSDWSRRPLSGEQVGYAALDAEVLLAIHQELAAPP